MKQINKNSWQTKLITKVYDHWLPNNSCQYYLHLVIAMLSMPFIWYTLDYVVFSFNINNEDDITDDQKVDKWHNSTFGLFITVVLFIICLLFNCIILAILDRVVISPNKITTNIPGSLFWYITILLWAFLPIVIKGLSELYKLFKGRFCKPIEFVDNVNN